MHPDVTAPAAQETSASGANSSRTLLLRPRDPLILRDARPFSADPGARAFTLPWPLPRTVAGAVRSFIGERAGFDWLNGGSARAHQIAVHGPLLVAQARPAGRWKVFVPAPRDAVLFHREKDNQPDFLCLRPIEPTDGIGVSPAVGKNDADYPFDLAGGGLRPLSVEGDVKRDSDAPAFWSLDDAVHWLATRDRRSWRRRLQESRPPAVGHAALPKESRVHVSINPASQTGAEGALFATTALAFSDHPRSHPILPDHQEPATAMLCRVETSEIWGAEPGFLPLGGERRLVEATIDPDPPSVAAWPAVRLPDPAALAGARGLRLQFVTPAIFSYGWLPAWLNDGVPPGCAGLGIQLRLVAAAIDRRQPVSGWSIARTPNGNGGTREVGAKATIYAVPAGGVYFFAFDKPPASQDIWNQLWARLWLRPLSDEKEHRDEGFGLALPGIW